MLRSQQRRTYTRSGLILDDDDGDDAAVAADDAGDHCSGMKGLEKTGIECSSGAVMSPNTTLFG